LNGRQAGYQKDSTQYGEIKDIHLQGFLAVLAEALKSLLLGAPLEPGFLIFSPLPDSMRSRLALMFAYRPGLLFAI